MIQVDKKTLSQLQIAMKLDEYKYEKVTNNILRVCPPLAYSILRLYSSIITLKYQRKRMTKKPKSLQKCMQTSKGKMTAIRNFLKADPKALLLKSMPV